MKNIKILLVDDDHMVSELLKLVLEQHETVVEIESDPTKVLARLDEVRPDLMILDLVMPGADGLQVLEQIRSVPRHSKLPVVLATARENPLTPAECLELRVVGFIRKPYRAQQIASNLKNLLRRTTRYMKLDLE